MANHISLLVLFLSFVYVANTAGIKQDIDWETNTENHVYKALIDRLDRLEGEVAQHPHDLEALHREIDNLRRSHADEIASLRAEFVPEISRSKHAKNVCNDDVGTAKAYDTLEGGHVDAKPEIEAVDEEPVEAASVTNKADGHRFSIRGEHVPTHRIVRAGDDADVAFLATLNADQVHIGLNQNIHFDNVITNIGGAYDPGRGVFKAPSPGTYVFLVSLVTSHRDLGSFGLFLNSQLTTKLFLNGAENDYDGSSNSAVLHMNQNDEFSVKHLDANHGVRGGFYSSVSGFRLFSGLQLTSETVGK